MVDTEFERYLQDNYISRAEFEQRFEAAREDVRRFVNSHDQYLREQEFKLTTQVQRVELAVTSFTQMIKMQTDFNERMRNDYDVLADRLTQSEKGVLRIENSITDIFDSLYGNPARPDDNPSMMRVIRSGFERASADRDAQSLAIEELKTTVEQWQHTFNRINNAVSTSVNWALKTTAGRTVSVVIYGLIIGRFTFPEEMDQIGEIIVAMIRAMFGVPNVP